MEKELHLTFVSGQKVLNTENANQSSLPSKISQKINDAIIPSIVIIFCTKNVSKRPHTGCTIKLSAKVKDIRKSL